MPGPTRKELRGWQKRVFRLMKDGNTRAALAETRELAARASESPDVQCLCGDVYLHLGDADASVAAFRKAGELAQSSQWKTAMRAARALSAAGRDEDALAVLQRLDLHAVPGLVGLERAGLYRRLDRPDEAVAELSDTLEINPHYGLARDELIDLLETLGRPEEADAARRWRDRLPHKLSPAEVVRAINAAFPGDSGRYVVNLGCRDGKMKDPCYELYQEGYPGLAVDAVEELPKLHKNLPQPEVRKLLGTWITPGTIAEVLERGECPPQPALIKIDIDSYDGPVLEAALAVIDPDVIQVEVNAEFPPPLKFTVQYDARYSHSWQAGFAGCSVSYLTSICRPRGYELLQIDLTDPHDRGGVILVKERYLGLWDVTAPVDERALFLREPYHAGRGLAEIGVDTQPWREELDFQVLLSDAWDACVAASLSRYGAVLPFILTL
jgi:tetratricopeptide (TPR) repeat protein